MTLLEPVATPDPVSPGETVMVQLPFMNTGPINANLNLEVFTLGTSRPTSFPAISGTTTIGTVHFTVPAVATPGSYDTRVFAWDTGNPDVALISEEVLRVFSVS